MSIKIEVWGPYACFSRPEMKVERVSYDIITPSAARGLIESIYWHPGLRYHIDKIYLLEPMGGFKSSPKEAIRFTNIRRNEVSSTISCKNIFEAIKSEKLPKPLETSKDIQQRAATILQDVHYVIEAHFTLTDKASPCDTPAKFQSILRRRLSKGSCYSQPYFGCREFPANFREWERGDIPSLPETRELGYMLYDLDFSDLSNIRPVFFRAKLENGVMDTSRCEVVS